MGHPSIENLTPFTFEPLFLADEDMRPLLVTVLKATYDIGPRGELVRAEEQAPLELAGQRWDEEEGASERFEPEVAFIKPATDVVLVGHAHAQERGTKELLVALRVGPVQKGVRVLGDRAWFKAVGRIGMTKPLPFERIPLRYERAFGGWDRSHPDAAQHTFEPRNPVGVSFRGKGGRFEEGMRLPNLEDPARPLVNWGDCPPPACFGFLGPSWQPRASFSGTHDAAWEKSRKPLLPRDFDRRFFNAAPPGLIAPGYLRGDEPVVVANASPQGRLSFQLPGLPPPRVWVVRSGRPDSELALKLDTVIIDTDEMKLLLLWRAHLVLAREPLEVREVEVSQPAR